VFQCRDESGSILLHIACDKGFPLELVRKILEAYPAGICERNHDGNIPLQISHLRDEESEVTRFLQHESLVNPQPPSLYHIYASYFLRASLSVGRQTATASSTPAPPSERDVENERIFDDNEDPDVSMEYVD